MFNKISHIDGLVSDKEILFSTRFDYMFPEAARSKPCLLTRSEGTVTGLRQLADAMADPGEIGDPQASFDSAIPAVFTYFGQFIDHDITARTDRDGSVSQIGRNEIPFPHEPDYIVENLMNGRRPQLDLDSVFGEGPSLVAAATTQSDILYDGNMRLKTFEAAGPPARRDLMRGEGRAAIIPDERNDENLIISQIQFAFLRFYNNVHSSAGGSPGHAHIRARQLVRWAYQYVVVNDYLKVVCDPLIVEDTLANGPRYLGAAAGRGSSFMPLEFSTSAFRFAHSMIRPFYKLNAEALDIKIMDLLGPAANDTYFGADGQLKADFIIDWPRFTGGANVQRARKIDTKLARGLFQLPLGNRSGDPVLGHLARSNLIRGFNLSVPTGQAVADAFGVVPLTAAEMIGGESAAITDALQAHYFDHRTPLWYYILREAAVQQDGERLGEIGSRIVCETIINFLKQDPTSYLNNFDDTAVKKTGIDVDPGAGGTIKKLVNIFDFAGVL